MSTNGAEPARRGARPRQALPDHARGSSSRSRSAPFRQSTGFTFDVKRGETSGSSARAAAASRRPRAYLCACSIRASGQVDTAARRSRMSSEQRTAAPESRDLPRPKLPLNPRRPVGAIGEPYVDPRARHRQGERRRACRSAGAGRPQPRALQPLSDQFSGGQRQRIGVARALALQAAAGRRGRAGFGARRLDRGQMLNLLGTLRASSA